MAKKSARFGVRDASGARSTEFMVIWKSTVSDVYLAARVLGGTMKASLHERGQCHVHGPDPKAWKQPGAPPRYLEVWNIDPTSKYEWPISVVIPTSELRCGEWPKFKDKGTIWVDPGTNSAVEFGVFLTRIRPRPLMEIRAAGWDPIIVLEQLPDGRDLWVGVGKTEIPEDRKASLLEEKARAQQMMAQAVAPRLNPRMLLFASHGRGTRHLVDAAADNAPSKP